MGESRRLRNADKLPKVFQIHCTFGMAKIDGIYNEVDDFGLITSAEARELGVSNAELVQQAHRRKLQRMSRSVYRVRSASRKEV